MHFGCSVLLMCILSHEFWMFCIPNMYTVVHILDVLYFEYVNCRMHFGCSVLRICILSYAFWMFCIMNKYTVLCILDVLYY